METKSDQLVSKNEKLSGSKPVARPRVPKLKNGRADIAAKSAAGKVFGVIVEAKLLKQHNQFMAAAAVTRSEQKFNYAKFNKIFEGSLTAMEIAATVYAEKNPKAVSEKTKPLGSLEIDRANRLARIVELAERVFGNSEKSSRWLRKPRAKLAGQTPLELIATDAGGAVVEEMLHRIDHGMYA